MSYGTRAEYRDGLAFDIRLQGHDLTVDADTSSGGKGYGPTPKSLILSALAGCTGMDVAAILGKMKMPFESFAVEVDGESAESHPHVYTKVMVRYLFTGNETDREKIEKAVNLSLTKYCPVAAMIKASAELEYEIITDA
ncbi:MAG: OsmC family peroxiredoxin [Spirochaetaceae bacterium]|nr:MAG: OsmC family peroxiredoxin [Spirochaetaceae bacterium]